MKKRIYLTGIFVVVVCLCACSKRSQKSENDVRNERYDAMNNRNQDETKKLAQKYEAAQGWDSLCYYSYQFEELFIQEKKKICFQGGIDDIEKRDSLYFIEAVNATKYDFNYLAEISLSQDQFKQMQLSGNDYLEASFILEVTQIEKITPRIATIYENDYDEEGHQIGNAYLDLDFDESLVLIKGNLVDFYIFEVFHE
jgi:hypothetical protein